jgi:glycosyltransferase involved in cell wall biosynthesis
MKISVCIATYNHEHFIRECLDGVVAQQVNFDYEIVIGEDASTDNTLAICQEYASKYPALIKLLTTPVNLGMLQNGMRTAAAATGKYIAICEGDDYWTDPGKLQRQYDFLEGHPEYSMIAENGLVLNTYEGKEFRFNTRDEGDLEIIDLLGKRLFPTASVLFRAQYIRENFKQPQHGGDTFLWCYLATRGKVRYLPIVSSVYRRGLQGVVLSTNKVEWAQLMEKWNAEISQIMPANFDKSVFKRRNYAEYLKAFHFSNSVNDTQNALLSIRKCFSYQPVRTIITLSKFFLGKLRLT